MVMAPVIRAAICLVVLCLTRTFAQVNTGSEVSVPVRIDLSGQSVLQNDEFSITCKECTVRGDLSMSGGTGHRPDSNFTGLPFDFTEDWVGVVVEDFDVHVELEVVLTPTKDTNEVNIPLLFEDGITFSQDFGLLGVGWTFDPIVHGWVNSSEPVNFTYGFDFTIPANSAIFIPVFHLDTIKSVGFSNASIHPLNYTSTDAHSAFSFELSFRPIFRAELHIGIVDATGLFAEVFADVPKLDVTVSQVSNVTKDCQPGSAGTSSDEILSNVTYVVPTLGFDFGFNATAIDSLEVEVGDDVALPTNCLQYSVEAAMLVTAPSEKKIDNSSTTNSSGSSSTGTNSTSTNSSDSGNADSSHKSNSNSNSGHRMISQFGTAGGAFLLALALNL